MKTIAYVVIFVWIMGHGVLAEPPGMRLIRPTNTGIPGEEVRTVQYHPNGKLWVGARWPFWREGGVGIYDIVEDLWQTYFNGETGQGRGPLPSEFINDFAFASDGTAWIATDEGLVKYDGTTWTIYNHTNTPMAFPKCTDVCIAPNGHVWVNNSDFNRGGDSILRFDGTSWTKYRTGYEMPWDRTWQDLAYVYAATNGDVWVTNETLAGAARLRNGQWTLFGENIGAFDEIVEDIHGNIYFAPGLGHIKLAKWDGTRMTTVYSQSDILTVSTDSDGAVYFGDWFGNVRRSFNQGTNWQLFISGLNQVYNVVPNPHGDDIWIGTIGAVGRFDASGRLIKDYNSATTGQPDFFLEQLHRGRTSGNFYVASLEYGVSRFDGLRWENRGSHNYNIDWPVLADGARSVYEDRNGDVWIGTNGVARWDQQTDAFELWDWRNTNWGVSDFAGFAEDMNGILFAFSDSGSAYRFHADTRTWTKEPIQMYAILGIPGAEADSRGNIYFGGWFDIAKWDGVRWSLLTLPHRDYLYDLGGANTLAVGTDDTLWIGCTRGLVHYDGTNWTTYNKYNSPMSCSSVSGIAFRGDGLMGLVMSDLSDDFRRCGVAIIDGPFLDPSNWIYYLYGSTPLPHYQLGGAAFDANGHLWVSCISEAVAQILTGKDIDCRAIQKMTARCTDGKLVAKIKSSLPDGTELTLTRNGGDAKTVTINARGKGKTRWTGQRGPQTLRIVECFGASASADCG